MSKRTYSEMTETTTSNTTESLIEQLPIKKRKLLINNDDKDDNQKIKKFSDPSNRESDVGLKLMIDNDNDNKIDYTSYQEQNVEEINISGCIHKICYPPFFDSSSYYDYKLIIKNIDIDSIIKYPYKLDTFQLESIYGIENNDNVLVSAHTSAGKTTVAEYGIAKALSLNQRIIYTSPIKALSNQKYRDLCEKFTNNNIGLMTGDTSINRDASCIVMTTEILRNMLYRGAEIIREISWIIFDEIHYMKDINRGVVWEETLILLPKQTRFIFLSATIPNSIEFAKWIAKINTNPCHIIYTEFRPVPLQHYIYPSGSNGIYLCVDHKSNFKQNNFQKALNAVKDDKKEKNKNKNNNKNNKNNNNNKDIFKLIKMIIEREFDPCIIFAFSKKEVENLALSLSKLDFTTINEKKLICRIFNNAISTLNDCDKMLPQILSLLSLIKRGIGIHHSGLLPILKEIVEILFGEGLIRILFTTETFAMGVNFPAKCVIFSDISKWDGMNNRYLTSGEYIQMSGRAGRRGLDLRGIVILIINNKNKNIECNQLKQILRGKSDKLVSKFKITYPMLIQLQRLQDIKPTFIINRSFMQFQKLQEIPNLKNKLLKIKKNMPQFNNNEIYKFIEKLYLYKKSLTELFINKIKITNKPNYILPWLNRGRLLFISQPLINKTIGWSICLNFKKINKKDLKILQNVYKNKNLNINYIVDVLTNKNKIISVQLHHIQKLSAIRLNIDNQKDLNQKNNKLDTDKLVLILNECLKRNGDNLKELDPIKHLNINDDELNNIFNKIEILENKINLLIKEKKPENMDKNDINELCVKYKEKKNFEIEICKINEEIKYLQCNKHNEHILNGMYRVLRRLKMIENNIITTKGKIACEISCGDELILTEILFSNLFNKIINYKYINCLLSCFVFDEIINKNDNKIENILNDKINIENFKKLKEKILLICDIQKESKLEINKKKYIESFGFGLMDIVLAWSEGSKFNQITKMTKVYEGTIIRCLKRLDELLSELIICSNLIGNEKLSKSLEKCKSSIKRDIVFNSSLYL